jgi:N-acetylmuramoyl-L-alanine amidase
MRKINKLIVHCSATREDQPISYETIKSWHVEGRGWSDIGYHYIVHLDGSISKGREDSVQGAHVSGHNGDSIGICYIGGVEQDGKTPKDTRTCNQKESLDCLLFTLKQLYSDSVVYSHNEFSDKACPSFDATGEYKSISEHSYEENC